MSSAASEGGVADGALWVLDGQQVTRQLACGPGVAIVPPTVTIARSGHNSQQSSPGRVPQLPKPVEGARMRWAVDTFQPANQCHQLPPHVTYRSARRLSCHAQKPQQPPCSYGIITRLGGWMAYALCMYCRPHDVAGTVGRGSSTGLVSQEAHTGEIPE